MRLNPVTLLTQYIYSPQSPRTSLNSLGPDCHALVPQPIDVAPTRSPQEVHSVIASLLTGREIVELGTRNGDGMMCFARVAASSSAVEYSEDYCEKLKLRASSLQVPLKVQCVDYKYAKLDADYITWWQQGPMTNYDVLSTLKAELCFGNIRPTAEAIVLFDHSWPSDRRDLEKLQPLFTWEKQIEFDEKERCASHKSVLEHSETGFNCDRARGLFTVARIKIANFPSKVAPCEKVSRNLVRSESHRNVGSTSVFQVVICITCYVMMKSLIHKAKRGRSR